MCQVFFCFPIDAKNQKGYILRTVKWRITTYVSKSLPGIHDFRLLETSSWGLVLTARSAS
ncbi:unnamed protein product [Brassica napus]|uniref:(rape) hypothetical protein n=1 Tax=Brassica napus TaxID=3708 RepID=A0A816I2G8_BRANA|nr:unnamed protein product [Brassica napus]